MTALNRSYGGKSGPTRKGSDRAERLTAVRKEPPSAIRAVLWDMDGTLIDSEELHWIAWRDTMREEGILITRRQFLATFGQRNDAIIPRWLGMAATPERIKEIAAVKERRYRDMVRKHGIRPLPGVATWLDRLQEAGWLQAIASSAPWKNIDVILEALSATHLFQAIVSAEDVHRGKPNPEVFLMAASRLGVLPANSIVVEDAVAGVEAAHRAGMHSIGVSRNGKHLGADIVVQSLEQLDPDAFETLINSKPSPITT
jgi:beta-phosphoglucomutase family hydrolase